MNPQCPLCSAVTLKIRRIGKQNRESVRNAFRMIACMVFPAFCDECASIGYTQFKRGCKEFPLRDPILLHRIHIQFNPQSGRGGHFDKAIFRGQCAVDEIILTDEMEGVARNRCVLDNRMDVRAESARYTPNRVRQPVATPATLRLQRCRRFAARSSDCPAVLNISAASALMASIIIFGSAM